MPHDAHARQRPGGTSPSVPTTTAIGVAGLLSLGVAMGFGRFSFTPLLPLMIRDGQLVLVAGGWVATANYMVTWWARSAPRRWRATPCAWRVWPWG